jgi:hypothetical protein
MVVWSLIKKKNHPTQIPNKPMLFCLVSLLHCPGIAIIPDPRNTWSLSKQGPLFSDQKGNGITTVPPASDPPQQAGRERARHSRAHAKATRKRTAADARPRRCPPPGPFPDTAARPWPQGRIGKGPVVPPRRASAGIGKGLALGKGPGGRRRQGCASAGIGRAPDALGSASRTMGPFPNK